jgi:hypothetical protein
MQVSCTDGQTLRPVPVTGYSESSSLSHLLKIGVPAKAFSQPQRQWRSTRGPVIAGHSQRGGAVAFHHRPRFRIALVKLWRNTQQTQWQRQRSQKHRSRAPSRSGSMPCMSRSQICLVCLLQLSPAYESHCQVARKPITNIPAARRDCLCLPATRN